jgi:endonuclease YncB( thermonuclease family)
MLAFFAACYSLDDVPVVEGYHCAPDTYALVLDVLDGDTLTVFLADPITSDEGSANLGGDTGDSEDDTAAEDSGGSSSAGGEETRVVNVRLLGVDAPEISHNSTEVADCYGDEAADFLSDSLIGETIVLSRDAECQDIYGRELGYVLLAPGNNEWIFDCDDSGYCNVSWNLSGTPQVLFNDIVIRYGYARVYEDFDNIRLASVLYGSQEAAQANNRGLWAECE